MSYQVLARKWRPRTFEALVGQEHVVRALVNALAAERLHHAYLFTGTRGVGKTTVARILAKCLNCEQGITPTPCGACAACREIDEGRFPDLIEVDAASRSKVDETRELMDNVQFSPARGRCKVYLIDEVHMFSEKSFNALLKTLEEPPPHVKFLLATTDPQKLPVTVLSRCLQFNLKRLPAERIAGHLARILEAESVPADAEAVRLVARAADGSMRDALSLLDQAIAFGGGRLDVAETRALLGSVDEAYVRALLEALAEADGAALLRGVEAMAGSVSDYNEALGELLLALQRVAVEQAVPGSVDAEDEDAALIRDLAARLAPEDVQLYYQVGLVSRRDLALAPDPRGGFEMALLRMITFRPAGTAAPPARSRPGGTGAQAGAPEPVSAAAEWPRLVERLGISGLPRQLANHCALVEMTDARIRLALAPGHRQLTGTQVKAKLEQALRTHLGREVRLDIDIQEPPAETPARIDERASEARRQRAIEAMEADGGLRDLCETFGTQFDPAMVRPADPAGDREGDG